VYSYVIMITYVTECRSIADYNRRISKQILQISQTGLAPLKIYRVPREAKLFTNSLHVFYTQHWQQAHMLHAVVDYSRKFSAAPTNALISLSVFRSLTCLRITSALEVSER